MSQAAQFWTYAEEAMVSHFRSTVESEQKAFLDLARSWTQAALRSADDRNPATTPARKVA